MSHNARIAKNTIYLYIRTLVVMFVSLYTSRLVLQALGVEDMGIYNVVGGIVALMSFLQNAQTKATSRFITYELGKSSEEKTLTRVFSQCMTIHILLAIGAVFIGETIGLYIVHHWTNIPPERWFATQCVYQFAILTFCIHIIRVPYDSVIVAHEDMSVYAYMSVLEAGLQLLLAWILTKSHVDNLILYAGLMMVIALLLYLCYVAYVKHKRKAYRFRWTWNKKDCLKILSFSGWTLLGAGANTATQQGVSLLFNNFIGLVANTALGLANQVNAAVGRFVGSFTTAFNPQIIKLYAANDTRSLFLLMDRAAKMSFALCYVMALPLIINMDYILDIWLTEVPPLTADFCRLILLCSVIDATTGVLNTAITATGKIRGYQIGIAISFTLDLICAALLLWCDVNPVLVFASRILTRGIINMFVGLYFSEKRVGYKKAHYFKSVLMPVFVVLLISIPVELSLLAYFEDWQLLLFSVLLSMILVGGGTWFVLFSKQERSRISAMILKRK